MEGFPLQHPECAEVTQVVLMIWTNDLILCFKSGINTLHCQSLDFDLNIDHHCFSRYFNVCVCLSKTLALSCQWHVDSS